MHNMNRLPLTTYTPLELKNGAAAAVEHLVCQEIPLEIRVNNIPYALLMRTPGLDIELAIGYCFTDHLIQSLDEVSDIRCEMSADHAHITAVSLRVLKLREGDILRRSVLKTSSASMHNPEILNDVLQRPAPIKTVTDEPRFDLNVIATLSDKLEACQTLWMQCRSTHCAAMFDRTGELVYSAEDVGRHNALDKLIGAVLLRQVAAHDKILVLSSRASFEMIQKAGRLNIPVVATVSAPTDLAVRLADHLHCTYVQLLKHGGCAIYTHPWRFGLEA